MKFTKYEYNHKDCDKTGRSYYAKPVERFAFVILINLAILSLPFGLIFIDNPYNIIYAIIILICISIFSIILEYNPVRIINYIDYIMFNLFFKHNVYKIFVQKLRDYNNILKFEKRLNISNLRTSCVNSKKILFLLKRKGYEKGIICMNKIILILDNNKKEIIKYNINEFSDLDKFLKFLNKNINN